MRNRLSNAKLVSVVGARPQFIKAFPLSRAIRDSGHLHEVTIHTGQHFDANMSAIFFDELGIAPPEYRLDIHGGNHGAMTAAMLAAIEDILLREKPACAIVYGDTNSTLAGGLAAAKLDIPVVHVEAGLRSFNRAMPEELNRVLVDHMSSLLLCPTQTAIANLAREGIVNGVHKTGDLMFDATLLAQQSAARHSRILETLGLKPGTYAVATVHRAENTDDPQKLAAIVAYLAAQAKTMPVVLPTHPRTRNAASAGGIDIAGRAGLTAINPLGYLDMWQLTHNAKLVFTDSGGLQKEAYFHRVPCVTLRAETEWVETVENGWNRLWAVDTYRPRRDISEYGDGRAAAEIVALIDAFLRAASNA